MLWCFCIAIESSPFLRLRRLPLVFTAVVLLHLYLCAAMAGVDLRALMPCDVQFWIMSIWLPFGMALLQASNSQFLHVATKQRKYTHFSSLDEQSLSEKARQVDPSLSWWKRTMQRIRYMDKINRILIYIGIAMVVEVRPERRTLGQILRIACDPTLTSWSS